ncbi:unnamed protein product, partial [Rotaria sp. Silwood2]
MLSATDDVQQSKNISDTSLQNGTMEHSNSFKNFLLKPELLRAITEYGFEQPSEVQCQLIPQAILDTDILCQDKSGMGKTSIYILATLQQLQPVDGQVSTMVLCHTRELAFNICREYERFCKYMSSVKVSIFYGGVPIKHHEDILKNNCPHIVIGTPGRILALANSKALNLHYIKHFIIDECDRVLEELDIRQDIQKIFLMTPKEKQVLMFSELNQQIRPICKKFMRDPLEIYIDHRLKLTIHNRDQYYIKLHEHEKDQALIGLLGKLEFNQIVIFVKSVSRCMSLCEFLSKENFSVVEIHHELTQEERLTRYKEFQESQNRILVTTNLFRGDLKIEYVNIVLNYDTPENINTYLHCIGRAAHFATKGLAITFVSDDNDAAILNEVQNRFEVHITKMPDEINASIY